MDPDEQRFRWVDERDVDLLLVEELVASESFRTWFLGHFGYDSGEIEALVDAQHSVTDSDLGETDVALGIELADGTSTLVLLENKIDATFQPDQLERYRARGRRALDERWDVFHTGLVAPEYYLDCFDREELVDATVTYESVREWLLDRRTPRADHKARLLGIAIERSRRTTSSEPDEAVTELHRRYWERARKSHPELGVEEPDGIPKKNRWIRFKPGSLPDDVRLRHKMRRGYVDLEFRNVDREEFTSRFRPLIEKDMQFAGTEKSTFVRLAVPEFTESTDERRREEGIRAGLKAASRLLDWYERVGRDPRKTLEATIDRLLAADEALVGTLDSPYAEAALAARDVRGSDSPR